MADIDNKATAVEGADEDTLAFAQALNLPAGVLEKLGATAKVEPETPEPKLDADGNPIPEEEPTLDADGNPIPKEEKKPEEPKGIEAMQKRIDEITKARRTAEEERDALRSENAELKAKGPQPQASIATPQDPLADVTDAASLQARLQQAANLKDWAMQHWDGGMVPDGKGGETEVDAATIRRAYANADAVLTTHGPNRQRYLETARAVEEVALERYPELKNPESTDSKTAAEVLRQLPELKRFPNYRMIVGHIVAGLAQERADAEAKAKGKAPAKADTKTITGVLAPDAKQPIAPAAPVRGEAIPRKQTDNNGQADKARLQKVIAARGSVDALAEALT